jgi:hypothetical protein
LDDTNANSVVACATNALAELAIWFVVIDRCIITGDRGMTSRRWCARTCSGIAACAQQGRSIFGFLLVSVHAHFGAGSPISLLPSST